MEAGEGSGEGWAAAPEDPGDLIKHRQVFDEAGLSTPTPQSRVTLKGGASAPLTGLCVLGRGP